MDCSTLKRNYENMNFECYDGFCNGILSVLYQYPQFFFPDYSLDRYDIDHISVESIREADDWDARHASCQEGETVIEFRIELKENARHYTNRTRGSWLGIEPKEQIILRLTVPVVWFVEDGALEKAVKDKVKVINWT